MRLMVYIVMPAYNAQATIKATLDSIPNREGYRVLVCDDGSRDNTVEVARGLGLEVLVHPQNRGYGANQKTLYTAALVAGANAVVMLHPDNQYDGSVIPKMLELITSGHADFVLGNRMSGDMPNRAGMPRWKQIANMCLTRAQRFVYGVKLGEFHTGLRAYTREVLERIPFGSFSDDFVFDSEMIAAVIAQGFKVTDIPVQARYFPEASSINFHRSVKYGLETLKVMWKFKRGDYRKN